MARAPALLIPPSILGLLSGCSIYVLSKEEPGDTAGDCTPATWYLDADQDNYGDSAFYFEGTTCSVPALYTLNAGDCDDGDPSFYPNATEVCDGLDNDCDGVPDDELPAWYPDDDGDGYGAGTPVMQCDQPVGYAASPGDADDDDATVYPGAPELCDGLDNDQDGSVDEGGVDRVWYADDDGDGYGDAGSAVASCEAPAAGWVTDPGDCDDADEQVSPAADERCNDVDDDCDGDIDELGAVDGSTVYLDTDGDGYGDPDGETTACAVEDGVVDNAEDCDDGSAAVYPGAPELCDGEINDCQRWGGSLDEAGRVSFEDSHGAWEDWTDAVDWSAPGAPAALTITASGTLRFCAGTYYVQMETTAPWLDVIGVEGADSTTLSSNYSGAVITADGTNMQIQGLSVVESGGEDAPAILFKQGLLDVDESSFEDNWSGTYSAGLHAIDAWVRLTGSAFVGNISEAEGAGGGLGVVASALSTFWLTLEDSHFESNEAPNGGGVYVDQATLSVSDTTFTGNVARATVYDGSQGYGGAIFQTTAFAAISWCAFTDNTASASGGAVRQAGPELLEVTDTTFAENTATQYGGAIYGGRARIRGTTFGYNTAGNAGGALCLGGDTASEVHESVFTSNSADWFGGAIRTYQTDIAIYSSTLTDNDALYGGTLSIDGSAVLSIEDHTSVSSSSAGTGGAVHVLSYSQFICDSSTISNSSADGAAVWTGSEISSSGCEWDANSPDDIRLKLDDDSYETWSAVDLPDPFTCTTTSCL